MRMFPLSVLFAIVLGVMLISPLQAQTATPPVNEPCAALLASDRPIASGADAPTIRIVAPQTGNVIYGTEVAITVETRNFELALGSGHWHLWVNGTLRGMLYQASGVIELRPGTYQLCASLGDPNHMDLGMPDGVTFTVQEPAPGTVIPTLAVAREAAPVIDEPGVTPLAVIGILSLGGLALVLGAWLGARFPKHRKPKI